MSERMILVGGNKCPTCGKIFKAEPPLVPNLDREFYGGRVKFFKEVECDCQAKYKLCIERKFSYKTSEEELNVINMIIEKVGTPLEVLKKQEMDKLQEQAEAKAIEAVHEAIVEGGNVPTLKQRQEIKQQTILATILDKDTKIETLCVHTIKELRIMCKRRKIKFNATEPKKALAEKLLAYDPSMVVANPED